MVKNANGINFPTFKIAPGGHIVTKDLWNSIFSLKSYFKSSNCLGWFVTTCTPIIQKIHLFFATLQIWLHHLISLQAWFMLIYMYHKPNIMHETTSTWTRGQVHTIIYENNIVQCWTLLPCIQVEQGKYLLLENDLPLIHLQKSFLLPEVVLKKITGPLAALCIC